MKHLYNSIQAAFTQRSAAASLGTTAGGKIFSMLLVTILLVMSREGIAQTQTITSISPGCVLQGQDVTLTISGTNFRNDGSVNAAEVVINGVTPYLVPSTVSATSITVFVPKTRITGTSFSVQVRQKNQSEFESSTPPYTINVIPLVATPGQNCTGGEVTMSVSGAPEGGGYLWYTTATGGASVGEGDSYTTPYINATTTYYVSAKTAGNCETSRIPVEAIIGTMLPVTSDNGRCNEGQVTLIASGAPIGGEYRWYASTSEITPLATGASFTTPRISSTTTYYVSIASNGCEGPRVAVKAKIGDINKPVVASDGDCGNGNPTITLTASGAVGNQVYRWYSGQNNSVLEHTGPTYSVNRSGGNKYISVAIYDVTGNCEGEKQPLYITNQAPSAPTAVNGSRCGTGRVELNALGAEPWESYRWYSATGEYLFEGLTYITAPIAEGTSVNYYVSKINVGTRCDGVRSLVTATAMGTGSSGDATGRVIEPENLKLNEKAIFTFESNVPVSQIAAYQWYYLETGSTEWKRAAITPEFTIEEMPGNIEAIKLELTLKEQYYACYSNVLATNRIVYIDNLPITPLPVELVSFKAQRHTQGVRLTWVTASEQDNKGFEIQVSKDAKKFEKIGFVESKVGTTSIRQDYSFLDTKAVSGTRYYRLKQIDFDGTSSFSAIRAVALDGGNGQVAAYPNPFEDVVTVQLNGTEARKVNVVLFNSQGRAVLEQQEETAGNTVTVDMSKITTKGMYILHVLDNGTMHSFKLMKR